MIIKVNTTNIKHSIKLIDNFLYIDDIKMKTGDIIEYICDNCNKQYSLRYESKTKYKNKINNDKIYCPVCARKLAITKKYNVNNISQLLDVKNKIEQTNLRRYGSKCILSIKSIREDGMLKKYGVKFSSHSDIITNKIRQTNLNKYGLEHYFQTEKSINYNKNIVENKMMEKLNNGDRLDNLIFMSNKYNGSNRLNIYKFKCTICNTEFEGNIDEGKSPKCPTCHPFIKSEIERRVGKFLEENNIKFKANIRSIIPPQELDIYIPEHKLAIEFNGLYWHSEQGGKDKWYHIKKTEACEKQGIQLIHILEDEWLEKYDIIINRLKNMLGLNNNRIYARKCIIKEIDAKTKNIFINKYHIQGADGSNVKLGAFYENELIAVMTFCKPRAFMGKKVVEGNWELGRFVSIPDTYTPGLASKLLKYFERNWNPLLLETFADRRWSQGNLYKQLGFEFESQTAPNYWYCKGKKKWHRFGFRKDQLKKFPNFAPEKTEKQIMDEAGYYRLYDCGSYKFAKKYIR